MAGIVDVFKDLLDKVPASTSMDYCRVWNNQLNDATGEKNGLYSFPNLACFIEIGVDREQLGLGVTGGDLNIKFHILHTEYDAQDGTMEQNLNVFIYRDELVESLTYYQPVGCSNLMFTGEEQDYQHTNVYHYIVSFKCSFIDTTAYKLKDLIIKQPPTDLSVTGEIVQNI